MLRKLIGIFICMLFIATTILPATAIKNNNIYTSDEEELTGDGTAVYLFIIATLNGYETYDGYIVFHFKIGWIFAFGYEFGEKIWGTFPIIGGERRYDNNFKGTLTQSFMCGYLIDYGES
jgi:hypothetical protein